MQPQFANIATPSEIVVSSSFTLEIGDTSGSMHLCIPYADAGADPRRAVLDRAGRRRRARPALGQLLKTEIQSAEVELVAELATAPATVEQLLSFKPGDFVELDLEPLIQAKVDGVPVFDCHYGTSNGHYSIKIDQLLTSSAAWAGWEKRMSADNTAPAAPAEGQDTMADEWAAALAEAKPGRGRARWPRPIRRRRSPTSRPGHARAARPATTST